MSTVTPKTTKSATTQAKVTPSKAPVKTQTRAKIPAAVVGSTVKAEPLAITKPVEKSNAKVAAAKSSKPKKIKMVRDSFTMPKTEFSVLGDLKARTIKLAHPAKKTELIRAGIKALAAMPDTAFLAILRSVPNLKTGRPTKS